MAGWEDELLRVSAEIDEAREELERLLEERNEIVADAVDAGATRAEIARFLGLTRPAVQKMLKGPPLTQGRH